MTAKRWRLFMIGSVFLLAAGQARADFFDNIITDTFGTGRHDIFSMVADISVAGQVRFRVTFVSPILPASASDPVNSVVGFIDIDTDQNAATGGTSPWGGPVPGGNNWINYGIANSGVPGPTIGLGDEYAIDVGSEIAHAGQVELVNTTSGLVVLLPITYNVSFFDVFVQLSDLGGDDGNLNYGALMGDFAGPTDRAPDGSTPATSESGPNAVPEPQSMVLLLTGSCSLVGYAWRRRRLATA